MARSLHVARHHAAQRRVGHVVGRIERHQQDIGDRRVGDQCAVCSSPIGRRIRQDHDDAPGQRREQNPRAETAPARSACGRPGRPSTDRKRRPTAAATKRMIRRRAGGEAHHVGIEIGLKQNHRHEDEVRGRVARAVAGLFDERKFLSCCVGSAIELRIVRDGLFVTVKTTFSADLHPATNCRP